MYGVIAAQSWYEVTNVPTVDVEVAMYQTVSTILDKHCPYVHVKLEHDRLTWMTSVLLESIKVRDQACKKCRKTKKMLRAFEQRRIRSSTRALVKERPNTNPTTEQWRNTLDSITNKDNKKCLQRTTSLAVNYSPHQNSAHP